MYMYIYYIRIHIYIYTYKYLCTHVDTGWFREVETGK